MRTRLAGLPAIVALSGCLLVATGCANPMRSRMPSIWSIPKDAPAAVRKNIGRLYWDAQSRAQACLGLHGPEAVPAIPFLIPLLGDDTYAWSPSFFYRYVGRQVGYEAERALVSMGGEPVQPLIAALESDVVAARRRAASALGRIGNAQAIERLEQVAQGDPSARVRETAACALANIVSPRTFDRMVAALNHKNRSVRMSGFSSLARLNVTRGDPFLVALLESDPWQISRSRVLDVLRKQGRVDVVPLAIAGLKDPDKNMRYACVVRLSEWQDPRGLEPLLGMLEDDYGDVRSSVVDGLEAFGTPEAVRALCRLVADSWSRVRDDARAALIRLKSPEAIAPLIDLMETNPKRSGSCRMVLKSLAGEDFGRNIAAWRRWAKQHQQAAETPAPPHKELRE